MHLGIYGIYFALLRPHFSRVNTTKRHKSKLNILSIIGHSIGINTAEDTTVIRNLPSIHDLRIITEPSRNEVREVLESSVDIDILFFSGHGKTGQAGGEICINNSETLSVKEISFGLRKRIEYGLQLAIFNACVGLELGEEIADLNIPQVIVMKEAVPDMIAQEFLKIFLQYFSQGISLVQALRQSRDKLADMDHEYPYASWLPVLYYNPSEPLMQWPKQKEPLQTALDYISGLLQTTLDYISKLLPFNVEKDSYKDTKVSQDQNESNNDLIVVEKSIEFPPESWVAGTSILSYFSHILKVKYPDQKIKVRIEQEDFTLRMIIETSTGHREEIEQTFGEYGRVVTGKLKLEDFLDDPIEVMALRNKLEMAEMELRQTRELLDFTRDNNQQRIESLEVQVSRLHSIIEKGLQSNNHVFGVISKMSEQERATYNLSNAKFGGGFATEGGFQAGGNLIDLSSANNLTEAAQQIQELLMQLQNQGTSVEEATQQAASDLAKQAKANPTVMGKIVQWGQSLADTAGQTTVSEVTTSVVKLTLKMLGIPLP
jgi:hypothetical protein